MPGRNGGQLRRGNPGNKGGGRVPNAWTTFCAATLADPEFQAAIRTAALTGDMAAARMLAEYGAGKPRQVIETDDGAKPVLVILDV